VNDAPVCWLTRALITSSTERSIRDSYTWHQLVWRAFPDRDRHKRDFLTRLDDKPRGAQLLIVSPTEPVRPDWLGRADSWGTKAIPPAYFQPRRYRFQLHANPTYKPVTGKDGQRIIDPKRRKRRAIVGDEALADWLRRKGETGGFRLSDAAPVEIWTDLQRFVKRPASGLGHAGLHSSADFSGVLEVTDPALFLTKTFVTGIGSAKAFGFGLLVLAPC